MNFKNFFLFLMIILAALAWRIYSDPRSEIKNRMMGSEAADKDSSDPAVASAATQAPSAEAPLHQSTSPASRIPAAVKKDSVLDLGALRSILKKYDRQAEWFVDKTRSGLVTAISGGLIREDISTPDKALKLGRKIAQAIGVNPDQLVVSEEHLPATSDTRSITLKQEIDGYPVWGGEMNIFTRSSDGAVYFITNEARGLSEVDTRLTYDSKAAQEAAQHFYSGKVFEIEKILDKPVIFSEDGNSGELCWQIQVKILKPKFEKRLLFISSRDLRMVKSVSLVHRN